MFDTIKDFYNAERQFEYDYYKNASGILYIGKSQPNNSRRINDYVKTGRKILFSQGRLNNNLSSSVNHMGGKAIWQIDKINSYTNIYIIIVEYSPNINVKTVESKLLTIFEENCGCLPVANHRK